MNMMTLPAGEYVISDPCYVINRDDYDRLLSETNYFGVDSQDFPRGGGIFKDSKTGLLFAVISTAYGDGLYGSNIGEKFPVDAGCIAAIPVGMLENPAGYATRVFENEFNIAYDDGDLIFGDIEIYTDSDAYDNDFDDGVDEYQEWHDYDAGC